MLIIADENIPFADQAFAGFGRVRLISGRDISRDTLQGAGALVVRSVTRVDRSLLDGTDIRFVGTATVGTDHVDTGYLRSAGIGFADAAGCSTQSVAEYVLATLLLLEEAGRSIRGERIGIVGAGRIGSRVAGMARAVGLEPVFHDPPREQREPSFRSAAIGDILACRIITLHVPLTTGGPHPTHHIVNAGFLAGMQPDAILINTSRGGVVSSGSLSAETTRGRDVVLDVWENEPEVPGELFEACRIITPHIAGYAWDARLRGTEMIAGSLAEYFGMKSSWSASAVLPHERVVVDLRQFTDDGAALRHAVTTACPVGTDDRMFRTLQILDAPARRAGFDVQRRDYPKRREFGAYSVLADSAMLRDTLSALGFSPA